ncbi:MAG: ATP-dependent metallopeptidase FtsH/Yme1/Tma family protein [Actinobacteria bacterium]|jgi:cell division protease FtsH|nr:ATP-dependent metallopeptidase FtsH/Yme1/Tma family protein [Actinomycetota bacterium]NCV96180.1 ATP-dependent metallopeptidase FtsH/Yme1/Tma family protein [Actinomycetota bacterium]NCW76157.1 ATP-dependent metallopeptidase FtsH/Yme1/Tma family protein [Actinomycetota bacterium]NCX00719.1 ATP-dependent metallopeptidase FtsH/Yme1/Tma family protein [Actinomycetota bacterium]NCX76067.1 ATP-dependent metallopeptidase FtsH/Yme1/Tma family protein [Actinomycetota bacterium]
MADNEKNSKKLKKPKLPNRQSNKPGARPPMRLTRRPLFWILVAIAAVTIFGQISSSGNQFTKINTSEAMAAITRGDVEAATIVDREQVIRLILKPGIAVEGATQVEASYVTGQEPILVDLLSANPPPKDWDVTVPRTNIFVSILFTLGPILLLFFLLLFFLGQSQGGSRVFSFGRSRAKLHSNEVPQVTFADVAGADEAIEEFKEIKDFLASPKKYQEIGAKIPKGVLLFGPPGTGKTLLARAVAGEAKVPFYSISGSDFVEMFVGVGAARVRDLFKQAKENSPSIIFVDEIDAVGRHRGAGLGGGHDEREQTLNQLLVEMDGFEPHDQVILIAATNRPDILDPALLRPGRFDRQIGIDRPDVKGREAIMKVHAKGKPLEKEIDLLAIARRTPGFTGADLANVLNEAALLTARENRKVISRDDVDEAIDRVMAGPQRKSRLMSEEERRVTAYHEGGHALVAHALPHTDPVHKITIMPRGHALGYTMVLPDEDKYSITRNQMLDQLAYTMGGRAAEELVFHDPTTGASNDIEKATALARAMVTQYGMTEKLGAIKLGTSDSAPFLGRDYGHQRDYSEDIASAVDQEIKSLIEGAHQEAYEILVENRSILDSLVEELLEKETLHKEEIEVIFKRVAARPKRPAWTGSVDRVPSKIPPVEIKKRAEVVEEKPKRKKKSASNNEQ